MRTRRSHWLGVILLVGCGTETVRLDIPVQDDTPWAIIVSEVEGNTSARLIDVRSPTGLPAFDNVEAQVRLTALFYRDRPSLELGRLTLVESGVPLPQADSVQSVEFDRTNVGAWENVDRLPTNLSALRIAMSDVTPCPRFEVDTIEIPSDAKDITFATRIADDAVLVGTSRAMWFVIRPRTREVTQVMSPSNVVFSSVAPRNDASVWLGDGMGRLWTLGFSDAGPGQVENLRVRSVTDDVFYRMASSEIGEPTEVLALGRNGTLQRYNGTRWELLETVPGVERFIGTFARSGPGEAMAVDGLIPASVIRIQGNGASREPMFVDEICPGTVASATTLARGIGVVVGLTCGAFVREEAGAWKLFARSAIGEEPEIMAPFRDGFMWGGKGAAFGVVRADGVVCDGPPTSIETIKQIVPVADGHLLFGIKNDQNDNQVGSFVTVTDL